MQTGLVGLCLAGGQEESRLGPGECHTGEKGVLGRAACLKAEGSAMSHMIPP